MSNEEKTGSTGAEAAAPETKAEETAEKGKKFCNLAGVPPAAERPGISIEQMYKVAGVFAEKIFNLQSVGPKLKASGMILRMEYYDPENWGDNEPEVTIDCTKDPIEITLGSCDIEPKAVLRMHADIAHRFWMQRISMMVAIARRQIVAKGPIAQVMRLLPIIKPSYPVYKEVLKELEMFELLAYPAGKEGEEEPTVDADEAPKTE
jgi:hypothetical protein